MTAPVQQCQPDSEDAPKCQRCRGDGYYYVAPHGVNPFNVRLPQLARIMEIRRCNCDLRRGDA